MMLIYILSAVLGLSTIASAPRDVLSLLGCGTDAATAAAEARTTALGLTLVVLEHEKRVIAGYKLCPSKGLIRGGVAPGGNTVAGS